MARFEENEIAPAADRIRRVIELNPNFADAHLRLGEALLWLGDYERAEAALDRAGELRYRGVELPLMRARLMVLTNRVQEARTIYQEILREYPYEEQARVGLAVLELNDGAGETTLRTLRSLERRFPENRQLLTALVTVYDQSGREEEFERYLNLAVFYHGDSAAIRLLAARYRLERGEWEAAAEHARQAATIAPGLIEAWFVWAQASHELGNSESALNRYERIIELAPRNHLAWYGRGALSAALDRNDEAERSYERAVEIRPDYEPARIALEAMLLEDAPLDDRSRAEAARRYLSSGRALEDRFLNRQAERMFRRGLQLNPFDRAIRFELADLYRRRGMLSRYLQELRVLRDQIQSDPAESSDGPNLSDIQDRIEVYEAQLRDAPAMRWDIDQFTAPRPRTRTVLAVDQSLETAEPNAAHVIGSFVADLLQSSQNLRVVHVSDADRLRSEHITAAREANADLLALVSIHLADRSAAATIEVVDPQTTATLEAEEFRRSGNDRIQAITRDLVQSVDAVVVPRGQIVERRFEEVFFTLGSVDGLEAGDAVRFSAPGSQRIWGEGTVQSVDDLSAIAVYEPDGPDNVTVGDWVIPVTTERPEAEQEEPDEDPETDISIDEANRVEQLFRLR